MFEEKLNLITSVQEDILEEFREKKFDRKEIEKILFHHLLIISDEAFIRGYQEGKRGERWL